MTATVDVGQHIFWLSSRALGVVALVLVSVSVGLGLAMSLKLLRGPGVPARVKRIHEATALTALIAIAAHGLVLLGDSYIRPQLTDILVPFAMAKQPWWTGVGIVGGWMAAILGLSFYVRRWIGPGLWRRMHRFTLLVYVLAVAHTLGSGTDAHSAWLLALLAITGLPVVVLATLRMLPRGSGSGRGAKPRPRASRPTGQPSTGMSGL